MANITHIQYNLYSMCTKSLIKKMTHCVNIVCNLIRKGACLIHIFTRKHSFSILFKISQANL